jgi:hypothetical protein
VHLSAEEQVAGSVDWVSVQLNHTIVRVRDKRESATFLAEILGLPEPTPSGPFLVVEVANDVLSTSPTTTVRHIRSTMPSWSVSLNSMRYSAGSRNATCRTGPTHSNAGQVSSTQTTEAAGCIGMIPAGTFWRSSPARTEAAVDASGCAQDFMTIGSNEGVLEPHRSGLLIGLVLEELKSSSFRGVGEQRHTAAE